MGIFLSLEWVRVCSGFSHILADYLLLINVTAWFWKVVVQHIVVTFHFEWNLKGSGSRVFYIATASLSFLKLLSKFSRSVQSVLACSRFNRGKYAWPGADRVELFSVFGGGHRCAHLRLLSYPKCCFTSTFLVRRSPSPAPGWILRGGICSPCSRGYTPLWCISPLQGLKNVCCLSRG